ncbi:cytochrome c7 [Pelotalea chapellei]|uniref:Cytochrome c family protein n=1 Tax=Pelotalea chapellei TaxID=44671 RepID=A0ABS5U3V6_9BACT|nr:cytochrome c7 [Pelotalea chapellei]MBT1070351.1 cytochrome c family protein [Pelotalea chapellei]
MKILIATVTVVMLSAGNIFAEDVIVLPAKNGNVEFHHKKHQEMLKTCMPCHEKKPGKIEVFGKDFAHKTCKGCHEERKAGPTKCPDCHKK